MSEAGLDRLGGLDTGEVLRVLLEGTASQKGDLFFKALVESLANSLGVYGAWVTEYHSEGRRLEALAFRLDGQWLEGFEYDLDGTPCERAIDEVKLVHYEDRVADVFQKDDSLTEMGVKSYMGVPLLDVDGCVLGLMGVMDRRPIVRDERLEGLFELFASRATAELQRLSAVRNVKVLREEAVYLRQEVRSLRGGDRIVGESKAMREVMADVDRVAGTGAGVLILGETGTGKELIARAIHEASDRAGRALVKVNCAAIPEALIESEFFGHEKGAFTGATSKREGRFTLADGGTIFLDEVGELPLDLQGKLLRVLQEGEFDPVGSSKTRRVDVRVLAATNRDLGAAVKAGEFREDLYYRLNVFPIELPALRDRGDDVVELAGEIAACSAKGMGRRFEGLTADCVSRLKGYAWPGNVRELQNVIERALITSTDGLLDLSRALNPGVKNLDPGVGDPGVKNNVGGGLEGEGEQGVMTVLEMQEMERANISRALEVCGGKVSGVGGAAKLLGMNASTLSSRMKVLDLEKKVV